MINRSTLEYEEIRARSLLSKPVYGDSWFHVNRTMNIYNGCEFACAYCDGRSERYHVDEFDTKVKVKANAPELIRQELRREGYGSPQSTLTGAKGPLRRRPVIGVCGGVSDAYQQAEERHRVTRRVLEAVRDFKLPVFILTKSTLVLRDLDLLREINEAASANVCFTVTLIDEETKRVYEPDSPSSAERLAALKRLREAGVHGGIMAMPTIPYIGDTDENMTGLARAAKAADAEFILFAGLTLKPGRQKRLFLEAVAAHHQDRLKEIEAAFSDDNPYGSPRHDRLPFNVMQKAQRICKEVGIRSRSIRHRLPEEPEANHLVLTRLLDVAFTEECIEGKPRWATKGLTDLAVRIEKGLPDMAGMNEAELSRVFGESGAGIIHRILNE